MNGARRSSDVAEGRREDMFDCLELLWLIERTL
jgi:hypothetical protein